MLCISLLIAYENLVLDQDNNFYQISLSLLVTCLLDNIMEIMERSYRNELKFID